MRIAVIGAGSWGTTVASLAARNTTTVLWARNESVADEINSAHTNCAYLPGFDLPEVLEATHELADAIRGAELVVMGVPSHGFRQVITALAVHLDDVVPVVSLTKGVEQGTNARMTEILRELLPHNPIGVLSGPNLAKEVMAGHPTGAVIAMTDQRVAERVQAAISSPGFRVYSNTDVIGAELGGAFKNVIAIAAGMVDGMGFGDNTKATLITRGLSELARLGAKLGGKVLTFGGLAGLGDLIATCSSQQSRNRFVGEGLGRGRALVDITSEMKMVAEGVKSCGPVHEIAIANGLELPIVEQVTRVVRDGVTAVEALESLLARPATSELFA